MYIYVYMHINNYIMHIYIYIYIYIYSGRCTGLGSLLRAGLGPGGLRPPAATL